MCQDVVGSFYTDKRQRLTKETGSASSGQASVSSGHASVTLEVSVKKLWSLHQVQQCGGACRLWLQANIPARFWQLFTEHLHELNQLHRKELAVINITHGLGVGKTLRKWMSYDGAVLVWRGFPTSDAHWVDTGTGEGYVDCGHRTYTEVAVSTWPAAFSQSSEDTVDDIIEAFFAFAWKYRSKGFKHPQSILDFVAALNNLCFATWLERFFW